MDMKDFNKPNKISIYDKDCLPTWDEIYNKFYLKKLFSYDLSADKDPVIDPYYSLNQSKLIMAFMCNQLNKLIFEDNKNPLPLLNSLLLKEWTRCGFLILDCTEPDHEKRSIENGYAAGVFADAGNIPPIKYAAKIPSTGKYSIFTTESHPTNDIGLLPDKIELRVALIDDKNQLMDIIGYMSFFADPYQVFMKVINYLLDDTITYMSNLAKKSNKLE